MKISWTEFERKLDNYAQKNVYIKTTVTSNFSDWDNRNVIFSNQCMISKAGVIALGEGNFRVSGANLHDDVQINYGHKFTTYDDWVEGLKIVHLDRNDVNYVTLISLSPI